MEVVRLLFLRRFYRNGIVFGFKVEKSHHENNKQEEGVVINEL